MLMLVDADIIATQLTWMEYSSFALVHPLHYLQYVQQKQGKVMDPRFSKQVLKNNKKV
jgi:hypothetical protein